MIEPIVRSIEVPCDQALAFSVFINEMDTWWPLAEFTVSALGGSPAKTLRVDAREGGQIVEVGSDDTEHLWGTIKSFDPNDYLSMEFHIPQPGEVVNERSLVEIRFTRLSDDKTRVELTQSNWEAFGASAKALRGGYGGGWTLIFEQAYRLACEHRRANAS